MASPFDNYRVIVQQHFPNVDIFAKRLSDWLRKIVFRPRFSDADSLVDPGNFHCIIITISTGTGQE